MKLTIQVISAILIINSVQPLIPLRAKNSKKDQAKDPIVRLFQSIPSRRSGILRRSDLPQAGHILRRRHHKRVNIGRQLSQIEREGYHVNDTNMNSAKLAEIELKDTLTQNHSAIQARPFVEKEGKNDFLVMHNLGGERLATIIPNAMYYNAEKKCVNWLDDCSLKGIRERLLRGVRSPFK